MQSTAGTFPLSYSETFQSFRAADVSAVRTGPGSPSFVGFNIHRLPSGSLVPQHIPEATPPGVINGLCHLGLAELRGVHVADDDQCVFSGDPFGLLVKVVASSVGDLRSDSARSALAAGTLRPGESGLMRSVMPHCRNFPPVAQCRQRLQAKVDADLVIAERKIVGDLTLEADVPAPASVLDKTASAKFSVDFTMLPKAVAPLEVDYSVSVDLRGTRDKRQPPKRAFGPKAYAKFRAFPLRISRCGKLATNSTYGIGVQAKIGCNSSAKFDQVECGRPEHTQASRSAPLGLALGCDAEVPDLVAGNGMPDKVLAGSSVLDSKPESEDAHRGLVAASVSRRSSGRGTFARAAASSFILQPHKPCKEARIPLPAEPGGLPRET